MKVFYLILFWVAVLTGCEQEIEFAIPTDEILELYIYLEGDFKEECKFTSNHRIISQLNKWLNSNIENWSASPVSFAPNIIIYGETFSINFWDEFIVLNYEQGQFTKDININEFEYINCKNTT